MGDERNGGGEFEVESWVFGVWSQDLGIEGLECR